MRRLLLIEDIIMTLEKYFQNQHPLLLPPAEAADTATILCQFSLKLTTFMVTILALFKQHFSQSTLTGKTAQ